MHILIFLTEYSFLPGKAHMRNPYIILIGNPEGKKQIGRNRLKMEG
jgi:hypothetical protein